MPLKNAENVLLHQAIILISYSSLDIRDDIELLRQELGIKKWNIFGSDIGSKQALLLAKLYPETVNSLVLDSVRFPDVPYLEIIRPHQQYILNRHVVLCKYSTCKYLKPDFETLFWKLVQRFNEQPLTTNISSKLADRIIDYRITGDALIDISLLGLLYTKEHFYFTRLIDALSNLDTYEK